MAVGALSPARAIHPPRRLPVKSIIGALLGVLTVFAGAAEVRQYTDTREVLVALRDLPSGATLQASDLGVSKMRVDDEVYAAALPADALASTVGKQLGAPLYMHQVLARAQLSQQPPIAAGQVAFTIPVSPTTADAARIRPGSWVAVYATTNKGQPNAKSSLVLPRALVYDVGYDQRVTFVGSGDAGRTPGGPISSLTVVVGQTDQALALSQARWSGDLDIALLPAEPGS
jgi:Flp pilus assembly protein CpaB